VFRPHAWSTRIADEAHLLSACLYAVLNPVAAGLCEHPQAWPWCSFRATAEGDPDEYATGEKRLLKMFGDSPGEARRNYAERVGQLAEMIRASHVSSGRALWRSIAEVRAGDRCPT
jgi:hypothetical protein